MTDIDTAEPRDADNSDAAMTNRRAAADRRLEERRQEKILDYEKGRYIFREYETGDYAYILNWGKIEIVRSANGEDTVIGTIRPGELFGEMALIDSGERMASARAGPRGASVYVISRREFKQHLASANPFITKLLKILTNSARAAAQ